MNAGEDFIRDVPALTGHLLQVEIGVVRQEGEGPLVGDRPLVQVTGVHLQVME